MLKKTLYLCSLFIMIFTLTACKEIEVSDKNLIFSTSYKNIELIDDNINEISILIDNYDDWVEFIKAKPYLNRYTEKYMRPYFSSYAVVIYAFTSVNTIEHIKVNDVNRINKEITIDIKIDKSTDQKLSKGMVIIELIKEDTKHTESIKVNLIK